MPLLLIGINSCLLIFGYLKYIKLPYQFWAIWLELSLLLVASGIVIWFYFGFPEWASTWVFASVPFSAFFLYLSMRSIKKSLGLETALAKGGEMEDALFSENLIMLRACSLLTNRLLAEILPTVGSRTAEKMLNKTAKQHSAFFGGCELTKEGLLDPTTLLRNLQRIKAKKVPQILPAFAELNSELVDAHAAMTSLSKTTDTLMRVVSEVAKRYPRVLRELPLQSRHKDLFYKGEIFLAVPEKAPEEELARNLIFISLKSLLEPLMKKGRKRTITAIGEEINKLKSDLPPLRNLNVGKDGTIDTAFINELSKGELEEAMSAFSTLMKRCYPIFQKELGKSAEGMISSSVVDIFEKHVSLAKCDVSEFLLRIIPEKVKVPAWIRALRPGGNFLIKESKPERTFNIFKQLTDAGLPSLCISSTYPNELRRRYQLKNVQIFWLAKHEVENAISPANLDILRDTITKFVEQNRGSVVLLDGLEYLTVMNGFDLTLRFLHDVWDIIARGRARLITPANPDVFTQSQFAQLERNMELIEEG